ncbi:MAG: GNAT family N-acetyltransferase [Candidatus Margulisbacteria bacterium]|jgi:ribosomal-protein-alanine N-acetyltransferase|nr:GNAT family N-acetyltransferase [Candidatus Margulisiibacteriota bacterium]
MRKSIEHNGQEIGCLEYTIAADELQITGLFVRPEYRRRGLAEAALRELLAARPGLNNAYLEVRTDNQAALGLYQKLGFIKTGIRKNYYRNPAGDAALLKRQI